jgi:hypothetical protein
MDDVRTGTAWDKAVLGHVAPEAEPVEQAGGLMKPPPEGAALFGGDFTSLTVTQEINILQLVAEIDEQLGDPERYQVVVEPTVFGLPVSESNPLTVHVHPASVDLKVVKTVVDAHTPIPDYGKTDQDKQLDSLKERLREGDLPLEDLNVILRSIIG